MRPESAQLLADMREAAGHILADTAGLSEAAFWADRKTRCTTLWNFIVIGEAMKRLSQIDPATAERVGEWRRIIDTRNVVAHGYDVIDPEITWRTTATKVPILAAELDRLLAEPVDLP